MELFGIKFAPLNIPLRRRLQTLAAAAWFFIVVFGGILGLLFCIYVILCTKWWWISTAYLIWSWVIDRETCETGGRRIEWVRDWAWWRYLRDYFPLTLERVPWVQLDPKRNYLFCCFPHGMLSTGAFTSFATNACGFSSLFPHHRSYPLTLKQHFFSPFFRELAFSLGGCSASSNAIRWILKKPSGGNVAVLVVGGAAESFNCRPGEYRLVLKKRKGFIKLAIQSGAPLVPVFSFGETDVFSQVSNPEGSTLRKIQEALRKVIGIAPAIPLGRGFFQYSFGIVPLRTRVATVVGQPLDVKKNENPTNEEVDAVHEQFISRLRDLFEEQKHRYLNNAEETNLIIE